MRSLLNFAAALCFASAIAGCHQPPDDEHAATVQQAAITASSPVSWGTGPNELTATQRGFDQVAEGPSAIALEADGSALLLDRLAGRIVRMDAAGRTRPLAAVASDAEDLAVGPDGAIVAYSPLRATAWLFEPNGQPAGEVTVPRALRDILQLELGPSRVVRARTGYQELLDIGSPVAPLPLPVILHSKREGAVLLADGRGLSAQVLDGRAELVVQNQANAAGRSTVHVRHVAYEPASAARVIGISGRIACLRIEHATAAPAVSVERHAVCLDITSGETVLEQALPAPGLYLPRRELAMGGGYLAFMLPSEGGLLVQRWAIPGSASVGSEGVQP